MAFKNYLTEGTYSFIENVIYSKKSTNLRFILKIYKDEDQKIELAAKSFEISGQHYFRELKGVICEPQRDAKIGDMFLVSKNPKDVWKERAGCMASLESHGWSFWSFTPYRDIFYSAATSSYVTVDENQMTHPAYPLTDNRLWTKWFAADKVFSSTSNLYAQIYKFLRTYQGFETVIDA